MKITDSRTIPPTFRSVNPTPSADAAARNAPLAPDQGMSQ
jgi:hypothetical protein